MRLRVAQFACVLLLFSSLGAAGAAPHLRDFGPSARYIHALLARGNAATQTESALFRATPAQPGDPIDLAAPHTAGPAPSSTRSPAARTASVHALTSFLRG